MTTEDFLLELYKEEQTHARHTETQRLEVTKFILVAVGVLLGFMGTLKFSIYCLPFGVDIILLGLVGIAATSTYVSRFDDHRDRARAFRSEIDERVDPPGRAQQVLHKHPIGKLKEGRVRTFWRNINYGITVLGAICLLCNLIAVAARVKSDLRPDTVTQKLSRQLSLTEK